MKKYDKPIVLIGMFGSGKSTVGKKLAKKLGLRFYDSDSVIEENHSINIFEIRDFMGEEYLKEQEESVISKILGYGSIILSTGGSSFANEKIRNLIKDQAIVVWLNADFDTMFDRVKRRKIGPGLAGSSIEVKEKFEEVLNEMKEFYKEAHIKIEGDQEAHHLADTIIKRIDEYLASSYAQAN